MSINRLLLLLFVGTVFGAILLQIQENSNVVKPIESITVNTVAPVCIIVVTVYTDGILEVEYC